MSARRVRLVTVVALAALLALSSAWLVHREAFAPKTITAAFTGASGIYPGDEVRVAGVRIGTITAIQPRGTDSEFTMDIDRDVPVPDNVDAVVVAPNLVAARYVQLVPPSTPSPLVIADGARIPLDRTAVPVEWDEVKQQLMRLTTELGPHDGTDNTSAARFLNSAAAAMDGNGDRLRETLTQLSGVGRVLADGSGDIGSILANLQLFVSALKGSNEQIVQFQDRFATLTGVLDNSTSELDAALTNLSTVVSDVRGFVAGTRDKTGEQLQHLAAITQTLADHRRDLEEVLHVAPHAIANTVNMFDPQLGSGTGAFVLTNFSNPIQLICSSVAAVANVTATETAKLCAQYLGPALDSTDFNTLPVPFNPFLARSAPPEDLIYTDPSLVPGAAPNPQSLPDMLLPAEAPPADVPPAPAEVAPAPAAEEPQP